MAELRASLDAAPDLRVAMEARAASATAAGRAGGALPGPAIGADTTVIPDAETEFELTVSQVFPLANRGSASRRAGEASARAAVAAGEAMLHERRADLADAFFAALASQQRIKVLDEKLEAVTRAGNALERRVEAGDAAPFEFARMQTELRRVKATRAAAAADLDSELRKLGELAYVEAPATVDGTLAPPSCERGEVRPPLVGVFEAEREAARAQVSVARADRAPMLGVGAGWITAGASNAWNHGFVAGLELELPLWSRTQDAVKAAEASAMAAEGDLAVANRRADLDSAALAEKCVMLQAVAAEAKASVDETRDLLQSVESGYLAGELSLLELLDAQHAVIEDRLTAIELQHQARRANNDMKRITGGWR